MDSPEKVSEIMIRYYITAFNQIHGVLFSARKSDSYWKQAQQVQLLKQIGGILDRFTQQSTDYMAKALKAIAKHETGLAISELQEFRDALSHAREWHYAYSEKQVEHACQDVYDHIAGQTTRMKEQIKRELREDAADVFRLASVLGTSKKNAYRQLRDKTLTKSPDFKFTDKAGKKWDGKVYLDMLTHTVMSQAQISAYTNTLTNEGHDLVKIPQNGAKDACRNWEGKILSLTGATPGFPTLAEAKASGEIFHPRCRHRIVAYDPEIDEIFNKEAA